MMKARTAAVAIGLSMRTDPGLWLAIDRQEKPAAQCRSSSLVEAGPKQTQPFFDACRRNGAVAQQDPGWWAPLMESDDRIVEGDAAFGSTAGDRGDLVRRHSPGQSGDVEPGCRRNEFEMVGEVARDRVHDHLVPLLVDRGRATDVTREGAVVNETRERCLRESR